LTRKELAYRVGCSMETIRKIESGVRHPSHQIAELLAKHLDIPPDQQPAFVQSALRPANETQGMGNLPTPLTTFIGREREITELAAQVKTTRLLTLTGVGGSGKTRLAIEVASQLVGATDSVTPTPFADGVWFVTLAPINDPDHVVTTIAQTLGVTLAGDLPPIESVKRFLRDKRLLLLLDNFEHVASAASDVSALLAAASRIHALVTSRAALHLSGERLFEVPPLAEPSAVELFAQRAQAIQPAFALTDANEPSVAAICARLDGLPLAIELAAARSRLFEPQALLARLERRLGLLTDGARDLPARQQTLRATIDWSYTLLNADEQRTFARLGIFAGGWTLEMAAAVDDCGVSLVPNVQSLMDKSLIKQMGTTDAELRFTMLETLREYALDRLEEHGEAEIIRRRHAEYLVALAERVQPNMNGDERKAHYTRFDAEQDNFRAALGWTLEFGHAEPGLRLAGALGDYWFWWSCSWHEGWVWISQLLTLPEANRSELAHARANALRIAVNLLQYVGEREKSDQVADESLALFRALDDKSGMAWVLADKALVAWVRADFIKAKTFCVESAALFREIGDQRGLAWALCWLASTNRDEGDIEEAVELFDAGMAAASACGADAIAGNLQLGLADLMYCAGDYGRARVVTLQAKALYEKGGDADGESFVLTHFGRIALAQGDLDRAREHLVESEISFRQARQPVGLCSVLHLLGYLRHLQGADREANALLREAIVLQRQQQFTLRLIESVERCAWIAAHQGPAQRAAHLFGAAEATRERIGVPLPLGDRPMYDRHLAWARADLDETTFDVAWAEGRAMTLEQAVDYALSAL
jgi:predicted ATPase/DNA-binding XRE family transcriptional regulator